MVLEKCYFVFHPVQFYESGNLKEFTLAVDHHINGEKHSGGSKIMLDESGKVQASS